jgi:phosphopantothenoylcysteine decarboxylase/phosphopantothenate--cysteine ligase
MSVLSGKKILLGVSGGIAAYKTAHLVRLFIKAGAHVQVIMTPASKDFITPLTLSTLSKNQVYSDFFNEEDKEAMWNNHVDLALWADLFIIAPATANTMSKMANGNCDNLLIATYLSAKCPIYFAPAMDLDMYKHPSTLFSFSKLEKFGNIIIPAEKGELASGLSGEGRMAEPENIVSFLENDLLSKLPLKGKKILITAGPTYEAIDPVRFIGNHSSGKMGYDIASEAANMGAEVILVSGPSHQSLKNDSIQLIKVVSAQEMYDVCLANFENIDVAIAAAAVADYRPKDIATQKIKKQETNLTIELEKTQDILATLGKKKKNQFLIGFALETENEVEHAKNKIKNKNLDLIVLNSCLK